MDTQGFVFQPTDSTEDPFVQAILNDLDGALRKSPSPAADFVLRQYEPQLIATRARTLAVPLTREIRDQLRKKFLLPRQDLTLKTAPPSSEQIKPSIDNQIHEHVRNYIVDLFPTQRLIIREHVTLLDLVPHRRRDPFRNPTAALAIDMRHRIVIVDGLDMKLLAPRQIIAKANQIVFSFWQFKRTIEDEEAAGFLFTDNRQLRRIAIVLNGTLGPRRERREAHDYAVDRFHTESELTVDAATSRGREDLIRELTV
jgi:hypothetical protein